MSNVALTDWFICLIVFFYLLRLFNFCFLNFFNLCCATTHDGEINLYKKRVTNNNAQAGGASTAADKEIQGR